MDEKYFSVLPRILNGSIAGIVGVTCVFPIDLVKTRLQNQQIGPNGDKMYRSMLDCGVKTFKNEGFFGMYRGSGVNLLLVTPEKAIKLVGNDFFRHNFVNANGKLTFIREMCAGASAGLCQIIVTTPMELLKIQLQDAGRANVKLTYGSNGATMNISATSIAFRLFKERGIFGLYCGTGATALRDVTFSAIYFPLFAHLYKIGPRKDGSNHAPLCTSFIAGILAASIASLCVTPMDFIKTRLQTLSKGRGEKSYDGVVDCVCKTLKSEGWQAFFKGGACRIMVVAPLFGIAQTVYYIGLGEWILGVPKL